MPSLIRNLCASLVNTTHRQRVLAVLLGLGALLGLATKIPNIAGTVILILTFILFIKALLLRIWFLYRQIQRPLFRRLIRTVRTTRRFFAVSPEVEFLHVCAILLAVLSFAYISVTKNFSAFNTVGGVFLCIACITAVCDTGRQVIQLTRFTWARTIGKILLAGIGTSLFYIGLAIAKQLAHGITVTNPKYYSEFSNLFATMAMPVLYLLLGSFILGIWAIAQLMIATAIFVLGSILNLIPFNIPARKLLLYRLQEGKRPPKNYRSPLIDFRGTVLWMRPIGLLASVVVIFSILETLLNEYGRSIEETLTKTLIALEYRGGSKCLGIPAQAKVAYLENGVISVVAQKNGRFEFSIQKCELP